MGYARFSSEKISSPLWLMTAGPDEDRRGVLWLAEGRGLVMEQA